MPGRVLYADIVTHQCGVILEGLVRSSIQFATLFSAMVVAVLLWSAPVSAASGEVGAEIAPGSAMALPTLKSAITAPDLISPAQTKPVAPLERYAFKKKKRKHRKRNKKIAKAIGAAIIAGVVIGTAARVARGRHEGRGQCRRWARSCDRGNDRACGRYYRNCDY